MADLTEVEIPAGALEEFISKFPQAEDGSFEIPAGDLDLFVSKFDETQSPIIGGAATLWDATKRAGSIAGEAISDVFTKTIPGAIGAVPEVASSILDFGTDVLDRASTPNMLAAGPFTIPLAAGAELAHRAFANPSATATTLQGVGRAAAQTAGGIAFGPLFPLGVAAGGALFDLAEEFSEGESPDLNDRDIELFIKEATLASIPKVISSTVGAVQRGTRNVIRSKLDLPSAKRLEAQLAADDNAFVAALAPKGTGAVAKAFRSDLAEAKATYLDEADNLWAGVNPQAAKPSLAKLHPDIANQEFNKFQTNVTNRLKKLSRLKGITLSRLDQLAGGEKPFLVNGLNIDYSKIEKLIKQRNLSALTSGAGDEIVTVLDKLQGSFFEEVGQLKNVGAGKGFAVVTNKPIPLKDAELVLKNVYDYLEQAKAFDALTEAKKIANPGMIASNKDLVFTLRSAADQLRKQIGSTADKIIVAKKPPGFTKGMMGRINSKIHNLIPFRDALSNYVDESVTAQRIPSNASSATPTGVISEVTRPIYSGVAEARQQLEAATRNPKLLRRLDLIRQYQGPNAKPIPDQVNFDIIGKTPGLDKLSGIGVITAATAIEAQRIEALEKASSTYGIDLSSFESVEIDGDDIYLQDKLDQADYVNYLRSSGAPTHFIAAQSSQFNLAISPNILLEPPKKKATFEEEPNIRLHRSESDKAAEYAY